MSQFVFIYYFEHNAIRAQFSFIPTSSAIEASQILVCISQKVVNEKVLFRLHALADLCVFALNCLKQVLSQRFQRNSRRNKCDNARLVNMSRTIMKPTKWYLRVLMTQINLCIHPV